MHRIVLASVVFISAIAPAIQAQQLIYTPVSPSFGGSSFNSAHVLSIAEIHRPDPPSRSGGELGRPGTTQTDFFVRQLENRILSELSRNITDAIFGEGAEPTGTFSFNDTELNFETLLDGTIVVQIIDLATGSTTTIEIPAFLAALN